MKKFEFRLQKVMDTTRTREELQRRELAHAMSVLTRNEELLERMMASLEQQIAEYEDRRSRPRMTVCELVNFNNYTEQLAEEIRSQRERVEQLVDEVARHREKLLEITKDKKILEKLKEKRYEQYKKKLRSMEQKFMDELSVRAYHHNGGTKGPA